MDRPPLTLDAAPRRDKFEPLGIVETTARDVVEILRSRTALGLEKRVPYRTFVVKLLPIIQEELDRRKLGKVARRSLLHYLTRILSIPRERKRASKMIGYELQKGVLEGKNTGDMERIYEEAVKIYESIENKMMGSEELYYGQMKSEYWQMYKSELLSIFGSEKLYNMAIDAIEKVRKRHLRRQREQKTQDEKV